MKSLKYIFIGCLLTYCFLPTQAQVVSEDFENVPAGCTPGIEFLQECVPGWISTHGSAGVKDVGSVNNGAFDGQKFVRIYVAWKDQCAIKDRGEGIALEYPFQQDVCYKLSYAIRGKAEDLSWILTGGFDNAGGQNLGCVSEDITPDIPTGSFVIPGTAFQPFNTNNEWTFVEVDFTPPASFDQLWLRASNFDLAQSPFTTYVNLDAFNLTPCCELDLGDLCQVDSDLTACPSEDDFGFISIDCDVDFNWQLPVGSSAIELTGGNNSTLVNATPGTYVLTVTESEGCTEVFEYTIQEVCCDSTNTDLCVPPENPTCISEGHGTIAGLDWDPVPGAQGYVVTIVFDGDVCGCPGDQQEPISISVDSPPHMFNQSLPSDCFFWNVSTVCSDGTESDPTGNVCVMDGKCQLVDW